MQHIDPAETFRQEAQDLLEQLEQALLDLGRRPDDGDLVDTAFRALHTLKGSGAMFGFQALAGFTHHVETAFDQLRTGKLAPGAALLQAALAAKDQMRLLVERPQEAGDGQDILDALQRAMDGSDVPSAPPAAELWRIDFALPREAMAMGTNPLLLLRELRELGEAHVEALTDRVPPLGEIDPVGCYLRWRVTLRGAVRREDIEQVFLFVMDEMELSISRDTAAQPAAAAEPAPAAAPVAVAAAAPVAAPVVAIRAEAKPDSRASKSNDTIRVPAERLDELMDRVGELVIAQSRLKQIAAACVDPAVKSVAEEIERLALELRDSTMGVRMLPIGSLFGRYRRLVHDLAHGLGKQVSLVTVGEETELDKTVIERLNDPLIHLIRNALDHGLEDAAGREAAGKPPVGRITLAARHVGAEVQVSIAEDGRGLDRARIRARAEESGLVAPGAKLADGELLNMIFQPGFSTAREVTSLSGRGVGMDVVKRTIEALRGHIDVTSEHGSGTTVTLRLPLTLAIIDGLLVRVGQGRYVIPLSSVEECVELSREDDARARGRNFLSIRGTLVPFLRLRELFGHGPSPEPYQKVVVVSAGEQRVGLAVDQVIGDHQTVIKSLSRLHADVEVFSGATILGDGTVALILDTSHLVAHGQLREERLRAAG